MYVKRPVFSMHGKRPVFSNTLQSLSVGQDDLARFHQRIELECSSMQGWLMELLAWHAAHKLMARQQLSKVRLTEVELKLKLELGEETYRNSQWLSMMKQASNLLNRAKAGEILHEREWVDLETDLTNLLSHVWPTRCISAKVTSRISAFIQEIKASIE
ncbi:hypothetical protein CEUSTIGMA_g902.t1 [Chlamydomonas eustigma]|uniref:Uncharacterized protein n=1 Tax=Chlamydomonas eustigma TaxID=1157962 RepID=A0A250WSD8_9CHLO|nr:hypothetical protein CEUSTIGMA_g902.t1 [Chlamydomonas eustigma]|eukprot:GAX73450.1 hypothetical protein CEUSTIGMA_g902.t1 [Chlamydomonas eustigma]